MIRLRPLESTHQRIVLALTIVSLAPCFALAQAAPAAAPAAFIKDDVYFAVARRINERTESPVSAIVAALSDVIQVDQVTPGADGKVTVLVKETTPSNARATNRTIRLTFLPTGDKNKWKWDMFEDNRKLYEVEKLFPYTKDRLDQAKRSTDRLWGGLLDAMGKEGEAAARVVETAKAILKQEIPTQQALAQARTVFAEAAKGTELEVLRSTHKELETVIEPVLALAETFPDLKTNDAFLRLNDELKNAVNTVKVTRKGYLDSVEIYNDDIRRLPFALVAYGMEYTKLEPKIQSE
jgi:LemA protein